jgi:CheY-like chemotaxis protein
MISNAMHPSALMDTTRDDGRAVAGTAPRVLVAQPRSGLRLLIGHVLDGSGLSTDLACTVTEALALATYTRYGAAVVDPQMECGAGLVLCRRIARGQGVNPAPVLTLHGSPSWRWRLRAHLAGARASLACPLALERFVDTVWRSARAAGPRVELASRNT